MKKVLLLALFFFAASANAATLQGHCVAVTDGDTIKVLVNKQEIKIRLFGIDAPEKKQAFGTQAKKYLSSRVFGKMVKLRVTGKDRYKRSIAWVYVGNHNINAEIIQAGYAWYYQKYAKKYPVLGTYEAQARAAKRGLWSDPHAVAPWEFRKAH